MTQNQTMKWSYTKMRDAPDCSEGLYLTADTTRRVALLHGPGGIRTISFGNGYGELVILGGAANTRNGDIPSYALNGLESLSLELEAVTNRGHSGPPDALSLSLIGDFRNSGQGSVLLMSMTMGMPIIWLLRLKINLVFKGLYFQPVVVARHWN